MGLHPEDPQLKKAASKMDEKVKVFNKLRRALAIADPKSNKGLNDDRIKPTSKALKKK
jgi:hypothetical protein